MVNWVCSESETPFHKLDNHIVFNLALAAAEKAQLEFDDVRPDIELAVASKGGWVGVTHAPGFIAAILSRLAKENGNGGNGIPGIVRALGDERRPSDRDVLAYLKGNGLMETMDDAKYDALQEALLRKWAWHADLKGLAYEMKKSHASYMKRMAREQQSA